MSEAVFEVRVVLTGDDKGVPDADKKVDLRLFVRAETEPVMDVWERVDTKAIEVLRPFLRNDVYVKCDTIAQLDPSCDRRHEAL